MWIEYNPNPSGRNVGDCAIRAVAKALNVDWETAFKMVAARAFELRDMPSSDAVWGSVLRDHGFYRFAIPNYCPDCYTTAEFLRDHPTGIFVFGYGGHTATAVNENLYDSWNSLQLTPVYYWMKP